MDKVSEKNNIRKYFFENMSQKIFFICAFISVISLLLIIGFIFYEGFQPFILKGYSISDFLLGQKWIPSENQYGILSMILASLYGTFGAVIIGAPIGVLTALFIVELAPPFIGKVISFAVQLLAGIPSVLYGVFGLAVIVPFIQNTFNLPKGQSLLVVIIVLAIMMLPTIVTVAESSIRAVPKSYKEASLALGASKIETIFKIVIPAAKSGILAAIVLGVGRAIGETMAVILVAGNSVLIPRSLTDSVRPLTTNIALEMGYAFGTHKEMLFATGIVLFIFIFLINFFIYKISLKAGK